MADPDDLLNRTQVAEMAGVQPQTISNWIAGANPDFPKGIKLGKRRNSPRRWFRWQVDKYLKELLSAA